MKKGLLYLLLLAMLVTMLPASSLAAQKAQPEDYDVSLSASSGGGSTDTLPEASGKVSFRAEIANTGTGSESAGIQLIVAAYGANGSTIDTFCKAVTFKDKKADVSMETTVKESYHTLKAFVWDAANGVAPLSEALTLKRKGTVNIEVRDSSGKVLASNADTKEEELVYEGTYNYGKDVIVFQAPEGVKHMMIQVDEYVGTPTVHGQEVSNAANEEQARANLSYTYEPALVYAVNGEVQFTIPEPSDYSNANNFSPYDSRAFKGTTHKITARAATSEEIYARRNLAVNPFDNMENLPYDQHYNKYSFPHAIANYVTRDEKRFVPRNAIDGFELNNWHAFFPYQSWAGGDRDDLNFSVLFGRTVEIDQVDILLRAQWSDKHDTYWNSAVLEFSDGTKQTVQLRQTNEMQTFKLAESKRVSWVHLKELKRDRSTLTSPYAALTEFKVYGKDTKEEDTLPDQKTLFNLMKKVNDYWISLNGANLGSYVWNNAVYHTGNMEAYYMTGDENYYNNGVAWADSWNFSYPKYTELNNGSAYHADNEIIYQTCIDLYNIKPDDERIKIAKQVIDSQMKDKDAKTHWWWIDALYMAMPVYTKLGVVTGDTAYFDQMYEMYKYAKVDRKLYNAEECLWYRDEKYIPGNSLGTSTNGKKVYWSRGDGWVFAALAKTLQDLPDSDPHRAEYEQTFKDMAAALLKCQGEDGFWRRNLGDYDELPQPETSGTTFFTYGFAWGINTGILDRNTYLPAITKAVNGLNATAIHPTGRVGRVQPIGENPAPTQNIGYAVTQDFGVGGILLMLSEVSKLQDGIYTDDLQPMLEKRMVGAVGVKVGSPYAIVGNTYGGEGCTIQPVSKENHQITPIEKNGRIYVPIAFAKETYNVTPGKDVITENGVQYVLLKSLADELGKELFINNKVIVIGNQEKLFLTDVEEKLIAFLNTVLTDGAFPKRPEYENRFDFLLPQKPENMVPILSVKATSEPQAENKASNVIDRSLSTRWSADSTNAGNGESVTLTFDKVLIDKVGVALYMNHQRTTTYKVEVQKSDGSWMAVRDKAPSTGITSSFEYTTFDPVEASAVRITGYGNSENSWTSITEVEVLKASN